ncbi:hypothetical protein B5P43_15485 [Bacillus sp. SRB_336]|nr:hypothetical protein B5P43_15485 [Bacillus sp. SRB_336]
MSSTDIRPEVDVIIAVHQLNRPLRRAVLSALDAGEPGQVRVIVVGHGLAAGDVWNLLDGCPRDHVVVVSYVDGIRSAAGPFNAGLKLADAEFVCVLGSDDMLEPGVVGTWVGQARRLGADAVLAPLKLQSGSLVRTPRLRALRRPKLDPVRDRVAYRTAPLGLLRTSTLRDKDLLFTEGLATGEDVAFSLKLFLPAGVIVMGRPGQHYVVGEDAQERVTDTRLPLDEEFGAFLALVQDPWFQSLPLRQRRSVAIKIARIHVIPALLGRGPNWVWAGPDGQAVQRLLVELDRTAPAFEGPLCRADRRLLAAASSYTPGVSGLSAALNRFAGEAPRERLLTARRRENFLVESNLRYYVDLKVCRALEGRLPGLINPS